MENKNRKLEHDLVGGVVETSERAELCWTTGGVETLVYKREIAKSDIGQVHGVPFP